MKKKASRGGRKHTVQNSPRLDWLGLILLTLGGATLVVLIPQVPSGALGASVREGLLGSIGWGAYAIPLPLLFLGGFLMFWRVPSWWPRVTAGYLLAVAGLWGIVTAFAPGATGAWGQGIRQSLGGAWGGLAAVPAVFVFSIGVDLIAAWPVTTLIRRTFSTIGRGLHTAWQWSVSTRNAAKKRAAFQADVALARRGLGDLLRDLDALAELYPASTELERWKADVKDARASLGAADQAALKEARADLSAWQGAVTGFAKDRAQELSFQVEAEEARPPEDHGGAQRATTFEVWGAGMKRQLDDAVRERIKAAASLEKLRHSLLLELTSLLDRNRRLSRERDADKRLLKGMSPRQLATAQTAHHRRVAELRALESEAQAFEGVSEQFEPWRPLVAQLSSGLATYPEHALLADFHATLAAEIDSKGRHLLPDIGHVSEALAAVLRRAEADRVAAEAARLAEQEAAAELARQAALAASDAPGFGGDVQAIHPQLIDEGEVPDSNGARDSFGSGWDDDSDEFADGDADIESDTDAGFEADLGGDAEIFGGSSARAGQPGQPEPDATAADSINAVGAIPITLPPFELLDEPEGPPLDPRAASQEHQARVRQIDDTLASFKLGGRVTASVRGPSVTRFEVEPAPGEKISRFANLADDLALAMAVGSVRIEAPIPGKSVIGLEVPNTHRELVRFREAVETPAFRRSKARMPIVLGRSIDGEMMIGDLTRMPHLLIAGSTGSGKSVAVNTLISSLLYRFLPTEMRFLMVDPKMVELTPYDGVPHLLRPVVTNPSDAAGVLLGAVAHMERRYKMMSKVGAKNLDQYNEKARSLDLPPLPFIAIIIDELADLMITSPKEVESAIMRLAQMARATGMHLILATQRPSVDILTSLIKVNVPARMAFAVSSSHDSRTILDSMGAERLIGMGDMLYYQPGLVKAVRLQGPFVSEDEIVRLADFLRRQYFDDDFGEAYGADFDPPPADESTATGMIDWNDEKLRSAAELVINEKQASVSRLQRRLSVGHARAGKLMDSLEALGVVGPHQGSKPRDVLVEFDELPNIFGK